MRNSIVKRIVEKFVTVGENTEYLSYSSIHKAFARDNFDRTKFAIYEKVVQLIAVAYFRGYFSKDELEDGRGVADFGVNSISRELAFIEDFVGTGNIESICDKFLTEVENEDIADELKKS